MARKTIRMTLGTTFAALALAAGGLSVGAETAEAKISDIPRVDDGSLGHHFGCAFGRIFNPHLCGGLFSYPPTSP
ncbi:hypothetical protein [Nesterenkonia halobia]|uniref:Uncharacterized protein n=1 Tax=Nesterenkonia halobia TaxID=37922 RepID=A0ABP6RID8_9MICC